ncbi:adenosine kinase [Candidatus Woesearchaeota archaeon]|nr:adenosine kinase [Candidatus Woesearchaeota archaeon]
MFDVFGIGNPMVDALIKVDEPHVIDLNLKKGTMKLVDEKTSADILEKFEDHEVLFVPGGDVVNTVTGVVNLGGSAIFCGKVGVDKHGLLIEETMTKDGVKPVLIKGKEKTGSVVCFITPDQERTFITNLGTSITLNEEEVIVDDIKNSKILYVTGYILEDKGLRKMAIRALNEAKKHEKTIAIDVSDPALVERCKEELKDIIKQYANIVFTNEDEAFALTGKKERGALDEISKLADIAIVKTGKKGSLIKTEEKIYDIRGFKVNAVDTTGAGDMFAAGFLFGIANKYSIEKAGLIANFAASKVVQVLGARLQTSLKNEIKELVKSQ